MVAENKSALEKEGITHILNCAGTVCTPAFPGEYEYRVLYLADGPNQDMASLFYEVLDWVEAARQKNGHVFVHCEKGISRSSTMAICYLVRYHSLVLLSSSSSWRFFFFFFFSSLAHVPM